MNYAAPLYWKTEDGREGVEVAHIPNDCMVYFHDELGPLFRLGNIAGARWFTFIKPDGRTVRVTRLEDEHGTYHYVVPFHLPVIECRGPAHDDCERGQCMLAGQAAYELVNKEPVA